MRLAVIGLWHLGTVTAACTAAGLCRARGGSQLAGYEVAQQYYEIGTPEGLAAADAYLRARRAR